MVQPQLGSGLMSVVRVTSRGLRNHARWNQRAIWSQYHLSLALSLDAHYSTRVDPCTQERDHHHHHHRLGWNHPEDMRVGELTPAWNPQRFNKEIIVIIKRIHCNGIEVSKFPCNGKSSLKVVEINSYQHHHLLDTKWTAWMLEKQAHTKTYTHTYTTDIPHTFTDTHTDTPHPPHIYTDAHTAQTYHIHSQIHTLTHHIHTYTHTQKYTDTPHTQTHTHTERESNRMEHLCKRLFIIKIRYIFNWEQNDPPANMS